MATLNDEIRRATAGESINDGLMTYYAANGGTGTTLQDLEVSYLASKGFATGALNDRWMAYLGNVASGGPFTGAYMDRLLKFWTAQPTIP